LYKKISGNERGSHEYNQVGAFVQINHKIGKALYLSPALRAEYGEKSGWEGVPQLNVSYKLANTQLRLAAGKTIREADFTERYNNYNKALVTSGRIGSPDLKDERSYSYEAGADYFGVKGLKVSGTFFIKYYSELIDYVPTPYYKMPRKVNLVPTGTYTLARNFNKLTTVGVETDIQYNTKIGKDHEVSAMLGVTSISSKNKNVVPSFYISAHANFLANFSLRYAYKGYSISINGLYKEREPGYAAAINAEVTRNYFVMNAMASANIYKSKLAAVQRYIGYANARKMGNGGIETGFINFFVAQIFYAVFLLRTKLIMMGIRNKTNLPITGSTIIAMIKESMKIAGKSSDRILASFKKSPLGKFSVNPFLGLPI
jgi:iron complex outermembrane receptor protein